LRIQKRSFAAVGIQIEAGDGEPLSIRVFGDYVYICTNKGKIVVLKSE